MGLYVPIEDLRSAINVAALTASDRDNDLKSHCLAAQRFAEDYCKRAFDGTKTTTEYYDGESVIDRLMLKSFPILSVSALYDDFGYNFDSTSLISSSDYVLLAERGELFLRSSKFASAKRNVKVVYKGGWIPSKAVVGQALATNGMTIIDNLSSYGQEFQLIAQTDTAQSAGSVVITGLDVDGNAQTETIAFTGTSAQRKISSYKWGKVNSFDALAVQGATSTGTIKLTASSMPGDIKQAISIFVSHLYFQKSDQDINITSRTEENESEAGIVKDIPAEVLSLLDAYRDYL